jgi:hypothetical protein
MASPPVVISECTAKQEQLSNSVQMYQTLQM